MRSAAGDPGSGPAWVRALTGLLVPAALAVASAVLVWAASAPIGAVRAPGPASVDALLSLVAALVCAVLLALTAVGATLSLAIAFSGQVADWEAALAELLTPRVVRTALCLALGVTVVGGPAAAAAAPVPRPIATTSPTFSPSRPPALPPGWTPDRPAAATSRLRAPAEHASSHRSRDQGTSGKPGRSAPVIVRRGDTLWAIAARAIGPGATDAQVAAEWPSWHSTNRVTIGSDPDLILPGQRLQPPRGRHTIDREESR